MRKTDRKTIHVGNCTVSLDFGDFRALVGNHCGEILSAQLLEDIQSEMMASYTKKLELLMKYAENSYSKYYGRPVVNCLISCEVDRGYYDDIDGVSLGINFTLQESDEEYSKRIELDEKNARKSKEAEKLKEAQDPEYAEYKRLLKKYGARS